MERGVKCRAITLHEEEAGGVEHTGEGVDLTAEVLRYDDGMVRSETSDLAFQEFAIWWMNFGDLRAIHDEDAALAILFFFHEAEAFFAGEEGVTRPGGAAEESSGIVGGGHGREAFVVHGGRDVLSFIHDKQWPSGRADDIGMRLSGEELRARAMDAEDVTSLTLSRTLKGKML